jgi:hypothetical protein
MNFTIRRLTTGKLWRRYWMLFAGMSSLANFRYYSSLTGLENIKGQFGTLLDGAVHIYTQAKRAAGSTKYLIMSNQSAYTEAHLR